ncbi:LolA family protein, partial [Desulfothermus sp.]
MRFFYLTMCLFLLIPGQALSGQNIIDDLLENYKNIQSIRTKFNQILKSKTTRDEEVRSGNIICKKSLNRVKVRWEIERPEHEILIVNGNIIWDYFPEEKLAYKYKLSKIEQSKIIFDLITGKIDLKKKFNIINEGIKGDLYKIKLVPFNPEPNMVLVYLWIDKNKLI